MTHTLLKTLLLPATLLSAITIAQAQITVGPRVGLGLANMHHSSGLGTKPKVIGQAGIMGNVQFGKLSVQPSLLFARKGFKVEDSGSPVVLGGTFSYKTEADVLFNYLEVPLNVVYSLTGEQGFQLFAGPYISIGLNGKYKGETEYEETGIGGVVNRYSRKDDYTVQFADEQDETVDKTYYKRINAGLNGGIGYKAGPIQAQLGYMLGLSNIRSNSSNPDSKGSIKDRTIQLSLAYLFGAGK
ncbi:PorT family protein [Hymenobacter tibetensis]|uniref:PorT family protein n=1 Tax=Hymenobacter tibetensis TaxID=497967 RepID=A0ABY4D273_9BACT|nr:porin family protein [Hymenobacter tibetensis]UOG74063.1 PorT family protein [Hymenobacter tibetensis]